MSISIPSIGNPYDLQNPLLSAYGWIGSIALNMGDGSGIVNLLVHPNAAAADNSPPIEAISARLDVELPSLTNFMQDPDFASAFSVIKSKLELSLISHLTALSGSTQR